MSRLYCMYSIWNYLIDLSVVHNTTIIITTHYIDVRPFEIQY